MTDRIPLDDMTSDQLDQMYDELDRARHAAALHRQGLISNTELYAVIEAPTPVPCPACRRADQAGLAPAEQHDDCASKEQH
jgi:hypothetical protein